ncbi:hypothetical protein OG607_09280 [Streptomyces sp. NBC_01537]
MTDVGVMLGRQGGVHWIVTDFSIANLRSMDWSARAAHARVGCRITAGI